MRLYLDDPFGVDALIFNDLSAKTIGDVGQLKFLLTLLASFPLALVHYHLPFGAVRHVFSIFCGLAFSLLCFEEDTMHLVLSAVGSYAMMVTLPSHLVNRCVLAFTFIYMSSAHLYAYWFEYLQWNIDYTMALMVLTVKLQLLAHSIQDGALKNPKFHPRSDHEEDKITPENVPTLLEFLSYVFFFPTFIAGPCFTYKAYQRWNSGRPIPPGRFTAAGFKFLGALTIIFLNKAVATMLPTEVIIELPGSSAPHLHDEPFYYRLGYIWASVLLFRTKYFLVWYLVDCSCILSGFGYRGPASKAETAKASAWAMMFETSVDWAGNKWDQCSNGNYFKVEGAVNLKMLTDNWNTNVNHWLKNVFYFDALAIFGDKSQLPVLITQVTSAFWHGFYPGYYLFFVSGTLFTIIARAVRSKIRPYFINAKFDSLYDIITIACTGCGMNVIGAPFVFLDWKTTLAVWSHVYFAPHIACAVLYVAMLFIRAPRPPKKTE